MFLRLGRSAKNPNDLLVWCDMEFTTWPHLKKFMKSKELKMAMKEAGATSKPIIVLLRRDGCPQREIRRIK